MHISPSALIPADPLPAQAEHAEQAAFTEANESAVPATCPPLQAAGAASSPAFRPGHRRYHLDPATVAALGLSDSEPALTTPKPVPVDNSIITVLRWLLCQGGNAPEQTPVDRWQEAAGLWERKATLPGERRAMALDCMKNWLGADDVQAPLDLSEFGLSSLPPLPPGITALDVSGNRLQRLPKELPASLQHLDVSTNLLARLPKKLPAGLKTLDASKNRLTALPAKLPDSLASIYVGSNRLTRLPSQLPAALKILDAADNNLTTLPVGIVELPSTCRIIATDNPIRQQDLDAVMKTIRADGYVGPHISLSADYRTSTRSLALE